MNKRESCFHQCISKVRLKYRSPQTIFPSSQLLRQMALCSPTHLRRCCNVWSYGEWTIVQKNPIAFLVVAPIVSDLIAFLLLARAAEVSFLKNTAK